MKNNLLTTIPEDDAWVAYSMPESEDYTLVSGSITSDFKQEPAFILQGWDKNLHPPIGIKAERVEINTRWQANQLDACHISPTEKSDYNDITAETIRKIKAGAFEKAVISRVKIVPRPDTDLCELFLRLKEIYPKAFTFMYHLPNEGVWCGATPELLMKSKDDKIMTSALAGTLPYQDEDLDQVPWTSKERHEQRVIEEFIEDAIGTLQLSYQKEGPITVRAGAMVHLQSIYQISNGKDKLSLLDHLHPGPAICGRPQSIARDWINDMEGHERHHYCGYLGPWGIRDHKAIFIHLRSMRIFKDSYALFLGGGITADSKVEAEWDETELKAKTMLSVIKNTVHG